MPELTQSQINNASKTIGFTLLQSGVGFIQQAYKKLSKKILSGGVRDAFNQYGFNAIPISEADYAFAFLTPQDAEPIAWDIMNFVHRFAYVAEYFDCDNFAHLTSSLMPLLYGVNTCGTIWGDVYDKDTGKFIVGHYFNIVATYKDSIYPNERLELYLTDALNPCWIKIEKGKPIIGNQWEYRIKSGKYF